MLNRYTLPLISALVVSALLASCQRKVEEVTTPADGIVFTVASSSQTKSSAAETSPVAIPVKADGGEELTLEVSSCPWSVEESSTPATKVVPLDGAYFSGQVHNSFGVMTYSASSEYAAAASRTWLWTDEAVYNGATWAPSTSRAWPFAGNYLTFFGWAPYGAVTPSDNSGAPVISNFTVNENAIDQVDLLVSKVIRTDSPLLSAPVPITFGHALTAVRFIGVRLTINSVTISGINDQGSFNMDTGVWSSLSNQDQTYSSASYVTDESSTLMLIPQTLPASAWFKAVTSAGTITASLAGQVWDPGRVVTYKITDPVTSFTVSSDPTTPKVRFSPGNLQYQASSGTWRFAQNQWDYVGDASKGNVSVGGVKCDNSQISDSYTGWIDLFGWGTSGHRPANYGYAYQPWSTYSNDTGYGPTDGTSGLTGDYAEGDWGSAVASTLGSGWRTLTSDEWTYVLEGRGGAGYPRYCKATVNDVPGLVIFPDGFYDLSVYFNITDVNTYNAAYTSNIWSGDVWTMIESAGCVFLPTTGYRYAINAVAGVDMVGHYWSSTASSDDTRLAFVMSFFHEDNKNRDFVKVDDNTRSNGRAVRLVQDL